MKLTIQDACIETARLLTLCKDYPNHPNMYKWLLKAITYMGTIKNALDNDERIINI